MEGKLFIVTWFCITAATVNSILLLPYGTEAGDQSYKDGDDEVISIKTAPIKIGSKIYETFYISYNGGIFTDKSEDSSVTHRTREWETINNTLAVVLPYFFDLVFRPAICEKCDGCGIYYRQLHSNDSEFLKNLKTISWSKSFVVTWYNARKIEDVKLRSSFQVIIATDVQRETHLITSYDDLNFGTALAGVKIHGNVCKFYSDDVHYYKQLECRSNIDYPGVFAVQISGNMKKHCPTEVLPSVCFHLGCSRFPSCDADTPTSLNLYPEIEWIKKKKGSKLSVMCTTESMRYYSRNFNWFKGNSELPNTTDLDRHSTFLRLNFRSLKLEDSGKYICNITDDETIQGKSFQLTVFDKPGLPANLMVLSKTTKSIYLQWSAPVHKYKDTIKSYIIHYRILEEGSAKKNTSPTTSFNLTNLIAGKTYMIYITAKNMFFEGDPSNPINVTTRVADKKDPLKLYPPVELVEKEKGSNFSIICTTERMRYYSMKFNWFKENGGLPNTIKFVRHSTFLRLDFENLKVEDTGVYKCNVTDDPSLQDKRFQLTVFDNKNALKIYREVEQIERKKGSNFSIMCTTEYGRYYSSKFKWFKENGVLPNTSNIVRHSTFLRLDFTSLKVEDNGVYKCNINDDGHLQEKHFKLTVFDTPTSLKLYPEIEWIKKKKGSKLSVICTTESMRYYSNNFNWFRGNSALLNTTDLVRHSTFLKLNFGGLRLEDSGKYNCNITDDETIQGKSFQLTVFEKPGLPTNLMVLSQTTKSIYLQWSAPVDKSKDNINSYIIYYRILEESSVKKNTSALTSFKLTNLIAGKTYIIQITAKNMFFEGDPSNLINVMTRVAAPPPFVGKLPTVPCGSIQNTSFKIQLVEFSELNGPITSYDIIVRKLPEKEIPRRSPQNYSTDDIKKAVDGLYVTIRGEGGPRSGDEVVIGNNQKSENGTVLPAPNNKNLEPDSYYTLFIRVYVTDSLYTSTGWYPVVLTSRDNAAGNSKGHIAGELKDCKFLNGDGGVALISAFVAIVILLLICLGGFVYCCRLKKSIHRNVFELEMRRRSSYEEIEERIT